MQYAFGDSESEECLRQHRRGGSIGYDLAVPLYEKYCEALSISLGKEVGRGVFGADMQVSLINDGPVTIIIDSRLKE